MKTAIYRKLEYFFWRTLCPRPDGKFNLALNGWPYNFTGKISAYFHKKTCARCGGAAVVLLVFLLTGCALKPPKLYRPEVPGIISMGYSLAQYQADEKIYNDAVKGKDLEGAKIARDRAIDGVRFAIENNYQAYSQGLMALRDGAGVGTDLAQLGLAAGSNASTNTQIKNLLSALLLGVKGASSSVQSRYYLNVPPEVIVLSMKAYRQPVLDKIAAGQKQDALAYTLNQARSDLAELFWSGTLAGARLQISAQASKGVQK